MFSPLLAPHLSKGDNLALVTLSAPEAAENPLNVERGVTYLEELGFNVSFTEYALANSHGHLAKHPKQLADDLNEAFRNPSIAAIICTGGGTNANRLLSYIDFDAIRSNPKVLIGVSNPTVVLNAITAQTGLVTFHGPVLVWNFGAEEVSSYTFHAFQKATMNKSPVGNLPKSGDWRFIKKGQAAGRLFGGNLWSLESLLGTPYEPDWKDTILFWEDIAKEPKRIDAMLTHFKLAGVFDKLAAMVVGELVMCEAKGASLTIEDIILELTEEYKFPILTGVRLGHTDDKLTIPIGVIASIDSDSETFSIEQSAVK